MKYRVGFCQFKPKLFAIEKNLQKLSDMLNKTKADLIVLPELAVSGYVINTKEELHKIAEEVKTSKTIEMFRELARKKNTSYVVGFAEKEGKKFFNSAFLINPEGELTVYRKTHLFNREKQIFTPGDTGLMVSKAKGDVKVGLMVCFDWIFPESARTLTLMGAEVICHPANLVLPWCQQAMVTRSIENRVFTITANRVGTERNGDVEMVFTGQSQVTNPYGEVMKRFNLVEEGVFVTTINPEHARNKWVTDFNHILEDRRPEFYK
ncbi:MAG: beta-ureidopropionase [Candidatus Cloacimonetes bacterium]|nr:beta-ureidopropionase [Candidatus Cloacimonadota bacterium]